MKFSKKLTAVLAAFMMVLTVFSFADTASAKSKSSTLTCGNYKATASLVSANKYSGMAMTNSSSKKNGKTVKFTRLYVVMFGTKVDKNGDNPTYVSGNGKDVTAGTSASDGIPVISSSSAYHYAKLASAHIAKKSGVEKTVTLGVSY